MEEGKFFLKNLFLSQKSSIFATEKRKNIYKQYGQLSDGHI